MYISRSVVYLQLRLNEGRRTARMNEHIFIYTLI